MSEGRTKLELVARSDTAEVDLLRSELSALRYENEKLKKVNDVLIQRLELGWGNFSTAYSSFERAAMLTEKVASKSQALEETRTRLVEVESNLEETERQKKLTQQRLLDLINSLPDAIALFDQSRVLVMANSHFYKFWADSPSAVVPGKTSLKSLGRLAIAHGLLGGASSFSGRADKASTEADASVFQMADGRWLQLSEESTSDGGLVVVYNDITRLKFSEQRSRQRVVREYDDQVNGILENIPQGVAMFDSGGALRVWNDRFIRFLQIDPAGLKGGEPYQQVMSPRGWGALGKAISVLERGDDCDPLESSCASQLLRSDGRLLDMRSHPMPQGGFVTTVTDISDMRRTAKALRDGERRLQLMTDALPALISYVNKAGRFEFVNAAFEELLRRPRDSIIGSTLEEVWGAAQYQLHRQYLKQVLSGQSVVFEIEQALEDGRTRIFSKTYVPQRDESGAVTGFFALEQDVTEQRRTAQALKHAYQHMEQRVFERTRELSAVNKQMQEEISERALIEAELLRATEEAQQASASKVKFIAALGHDLLQPLNAARLFSAALSDEALPKQAASVASSLARSLDDVESMITTLVDISKLDAGIVEAVPESFAINDLLSALANEFSVQAEQVGLGFSYRASSIVVNTDSQLLARILRNLLTNALRYTESGRILLGCRRRADGLDIEIADTGIGIEEDQMRVIFGEFQRGSAGRGRDDRGLGLGLAIVDKLAAVLDAQVSVRSLPSQGSVFSVRIPYGHLQPSPAVPVVHLDQLRDRRVLVLDNDEAICDGMFNLLSRWGCEVATAVNIADMCTLVDEGFEPEAAIMDYQLDDDTTGFDAALALRGYCTDDIPILLITANYGKMLRTHANDLGYSLMHKPVKPLKLRQVLNRLLSHSVNVDASDEDTGRS
mgnify:CR=1 FL=1